MSVQPLVETLEMNLQLNRGDGSPLGYFAATMLRLLRSLEEQGAATPFAIAAAGLYVESYEAYQAGAEDIPHCWRIALDAAAIPQWHPYIAPIQHLVLATNAHVHFDLPLAARKLCASPKELATHKDAFSDYSKRVIEALVHAQTITAKTSPLQDLLESFYLIDGAKLFGFNPATARKTAWRVAALVLGQAEEAQMGTLDDYDGLVSAHAKEIREPREEGQKVIDFLRRFDGDRDEQGVVDLIDALEAR